MQNTIAIICDCDETLAPDTTDFLLEQNDVKRKPFWDKIGNLVSQGWDPPQAWMTEILKMIQSGQIKQDTNQKLAQLGKEIIPYEGVSKFIPQIKSMVKKNSEFDKVGINVEFYIISSGFEDLIKGCSSLSKHFTDVFAGRFNENEKTGKIDGIKSSVTFTEKTKFLYAINKGIAGKELRRCPFSVNDAVKLEDRRIPFEYMVYLGDSPGDIPCFSAVKGYGGNCIGIVGEKSVKKGYQLARGKRTTVGPYSRNYTKGSDLRNMLDTIVKKIGDDIVSKKKNQSE